MERISVTQAAKRFSDILNRVHYQGACFELERGNKVIARLLPARPASPVLARDLGAVLAALPPLGRDAEAFAEDLAAIRKALPAEANPWG